MTIRCIIGYRSESIIPSKAEELLGLIFDRSRFKGDVTGSGQQVKEHYGSYELVIEANDAMWDCLSIIIDKFNTHSAELDLSITFILQKKDYIIIDKNILRKLNSLEINLEFEAI